MSGKSWILFMLYLFEFFELNNLHVVMMMVILGKPYDPSTWSSGGGLFPIIIPNIDYVHPKSVA